METTSIKKHARANYAAVQSTITKIEAFVNANGYQFKDRKGLEEINETNYNAAHTNLSMKKRKKLAGYIWSIENRPSLGGINKFLHFLMTKILKSELRVRVIKSDKEIAIQEKRKAYKELLAKTKAAYADYKTEKGDFYKEQAVVSNYLNKKNAA